MLLCQLGIACLGIGSHAGLVSLLGAGLQANAVCSATGLLDVRVQLARAGGVGCNLGALGGKVGQVVGLRCVVVIGPLAVGLGQRVGRLFEFELSVLVDGRVTSSGVYGSAGAFKGGQRGGAGASGEQAHGNQAGAQGGGAVK